MIGICVPAHDEQELIATCLHTLALAARHPALATERVEIVVVLDRCQDDTAAIVAGWPVTRINLCRGNVGVARATGMRHLIQRGARWLASCDADTSVSRRWLVDQLALAAEVVCGTVGVSQFSGHGQHADRVQRAFQAHYQDRDGHRHVHGANLALSPHAYQRAGGFPQLACGEDQTLVDRLVNDRAHIAWSARPRVITSARQQSRVAGGFASALCAFAHPAIPANHQHPAG